MFFPESFICFFWKVSYVFSGKFHMFFLESFICFSWKVSYVCFGKVCTFFLESFICFFFETFLYIFCYMFFFKKFGKFFLFLEITISSNKRFNMSKL